MNQKQVQEKAQQIATATAPCARCCTNASCLRSDILSWPHVEVKVEPPTDPHAGQDDCG